MAHHQMVLLGYEQGRESRVGVAWLNGRVVRLPIYRRRVPRELSITFGSEGPASGDVVTVWDESWAINEAEFLEACGEAATAVVEVMMYMLERDPPPSGLSLKALRESIERAIIHQRLGEFGWNVSRTAESLGVERTHLHKKMKLLGITRGGV